jgi:hypothetical protein
MAEPDGLHCLLVEDDQAYGETLMEVVQSLAAQAQ